MLIQWPDRYYHSSLDTPDRVSPESLAFAAHTASTYAAFLASAGPEDLRWLLFALARSARRRSLLALDRPDPRAAAETERLRGLMALASVQRLAHGLPAGHASVVALQQNLPLAVDELEGFHESEILPALARFGPHEAAASTPEDRRVPRRRNAALPPGTAHLLARWDQASSHDRAEYFALQEAHGATAFEVAWFACDGQRTLSAIGRVVSAEGWPVPREALARYFDLMSGFGYCEWRSSQRERDEAPGPWDQGPRGSEPQGVSAPKYPRPRQE